jgi:serine/threonine-protein kinase RsbW
VSSSSVHAPITMRLPFTPSSVSLARQRLKSWMDDNDTPLADGNIHVTWTLEPRGLQLAVTDGGGATRPRALQPSSSALAGRGMAIVEVLSQEWWSEHGPSRTTVYALLQV